MENIPGSIWFTNQLKATRKQKDEAKCKSSLKYLNVDNLAAREVHIVWKFAGTEPMTVTKAHVKCKILRGLYILQSNCHKFNQYEVEPTYGAKERHFIVTCTALQYVRQPFIQSLNSVLELEQLSVNNDSDLLQLLLDATLFPYISNSCRSAIKTINTGLSYAVHIAPSNMVVLAVA